MGDDVKGKSANRKKRSSAPLSTSLKANRRGREELAWERNVTALIRDRDNCILTRCPMDLTGSHRYRDRRQANYPFQPVGRFFTPLFTSIRYRARIRETSLRFPPRNSPNCRGYNTLPVRFCRKINFNDASGRTGTRIITRRNLENEPRFPADS